MYQQFANNLELNHLDHRQRSNPHHPAYFTGCCYTAMSSTGIAISAKERFNDQ